MGRFTDRDKHEQGIWVDEQNELYDFHKFVEPSDVLYQAINKLAHYEDLEEQGRLIELPCAVGDTVYRAILGEVYEYTVGSFLVDENGAWGMSLLFKQEEKNFAANMDCDNLGKTVFLTKEEAEAKLKELEGDKE